MVGAVKRTWMTATFKREMAVIMLGFLGLVTLMYMARILIFTPADPAMVAAIGAAFGQVFASLATMVVTFAGAMFGLDAWKKDLKPGPTP